jgi:hypothetical protein
MSDTLLQDTDSNYADINKVGYNVLTAVVDTFVLQGTKIDYDVGVFVQAPDQPARNQTTFTDNLPYGDFLGFSSPKITVQGIIDLALFSASTTPPDAATNYLNISIQRLQQIFKSGHVFTLTDKYSTSPEIYRVHSLTTLDAIAPIKVMCTGFTCTCSMVNNESRVDYTITFVEVRG